MLSEKEVTLAVEDYFKKPQFIGFYTEQQWQIQIGSRKGYADVVLCRSLSFHDASNIIAIVECKREGRDRSGNVKFSGIEQLKCYLCATDTRFGIFANSGNPNDWLFYENYGENWFQEVNRQHFERCVRARSETQVEIKQRIQARTEYLIEQEAKRQARNREADVQKLSEHLIGQEAEKHVTQQRVENRAIQRLKSAVQDQELKIAALNEELKSAFWGGFLGWLLFIAIIALVIAANSGC